jgi:hypothetical protein
MDSIENKFRHLLGVPPAHTLKLTRLRSRSVRIEDLDFEEHDAQGNLIARHHWWDRPLQNESGWRKAAPDGTLLKERGTP